MLREAVSQDVPFTFLPLYLPLVGCHLLLAFCLSFQFLLSTKKYNLIVLFSSLSCQKLTYCILFCTLLLSQNNKSWRSDYKKSQKQSLFFFSQLCYIPFMGISQFILFLGSGCFQSFAITNPIITVICYISLVQIECQKQECGSRGNL